MEKFLQAVLKISMVIWILILLFFGTLTAALILAPAVVGRIVFLCILAAAAGICLYFLYALLKMVIK